MSKYILSHDLGTSGNKATLFSVEGELGASVLYEYPVSYPYNSWVEQDPEDFWKAVCLSTKQLLEKAKVPSSDVAGVCFSGQMMGCLSVWIMSTGLLGIASALHIRWQNFCG